MEAPNAGGVG